MEATHLLDIIGIGHVGGLMNVLQPAIQNKPALLSVSNYLDAWPESVITANAKEAIIYESSEEINQMQTSNLLEALPGLRIIAVFHQVANLYVASNYQFLYDRPIKSAQVPTSNDLDLDITENEFQKNEVKILTRNDYFGRENSHFLEKIGLI